MCRSSLLRLEAQLFDERREFGFFADADFFEFGRTVTHGEKG
jgi:hypothetical protein